MIKCHLIEQRGEERRGEERRGEGGIGDKAEYHSCIKRDRTLCGLRGQDSVWSKRTGLCVV